MRTLFYLLVFIAPTALVLIYREQIRTYLEEQGLLSSPPTERSSPAKPGSAPTPAPTPSPAAPSTSSTAESISSTPDPTVLSSADIESQVADKYPLPNFASLESRVGNWRKVPKNAYPKVVTLKKAVDLELMVNGKVGGKSTLRIGQQAYPVSLEGSQLTVSGNPGNTTMTGSIPLDDTDFKDQVRKTYDTWKHRQESRVRKLRKAEIQRLLAGGESEAAASISAPPPNSASASALGEEPAVNTDGTVQIMIDSIKSSAVKEIKLGQIQYWRWNGYEEVDGKDYYTGVVGYTASTIFGEIKTEGKALIRGGKVIKWIYNGSEEEIK